MKVEIRELTVEEIEWARACEEDENCITCGTRQDIYWIAGAIYDFQCIPCLLNKFDRRGLDPELVGMTWDEVRELRKESPTPPEAMQEVK